MDLLICFCGFWMKKWIFLEFKMNWKKKNKCWIHIVWSFFSKILKEGTKKKKIDNNRMMRERKRGINDNPIPILSGKFRKFNYYIISFKKLSDFCSQNKLPAWNSGWFPMAINKWLTLNMIWWCFTFFKSGIKNRS